MRNGKLASEGGAPLVVLNVLGQESMRGQIAIQPAPLHRSIREINTRTGRTQAQGGKVKERIKRVGYKCLGHRTAKTAAPSEYPGQQCDSQ